MQSVSQTLHTVTPTVIRPLLRYYFSTAANSEALEDAFTVIRRTIIIPSTSSQSPTDVRAASQLSRKMSAKRSPSSASQYSSGKSTFVKYLIDQDYPGIRIGPEPTTDKFVAVMYGKESNIIPGNALVLDERRQFKPLLKFGNQFLNRFQAAQVDSAVLKGLTIIDTPGILSDNNNGYDY